MFFGPGKHFCENVGKLSGTMVSMVLYLVSPLWTRPMYHDILCADCWSNKFRFLLKLCKRCKRSYAAMQIGTRCVDFHQFKSRNLWGFSRRVIIFVEFWCFWFNRKVAPVWKSFHCSPTGDIFQSYPPATASWNASAARTSAAALLRRPRHEVSLRLPPDPAQVRKSVGRWVCPRGGDPQNHLPMILVFRER